MFEQASKDLPDDDHRSRKFVAQRLIMCARDGRTTWGDLTTAAQLAAIELIAEAG